MYLVFRACHNLSSLPCAETEAETEPETELETEPDTEPEPEPETETEPSINVNIRDFGLSTRIRLFVRTIFSICLSVYFLDLWRFLYLSTYSCDGITNCQFVLPSSLVLVSPLKPASSL